MTTSARTYHHGNLREALLTAAESALASGGDLSLRALARQVGVSHAAPRRHFADKQALLDALAEDGFVRLGRALREAIAEGDFEARLLGFARAYVAFAVEHAALLDLMWAGKHRLEAVRAASDQAFAAPLALIVEGQAAGEVVRGRPRAGRHGRGRDVARPGGDGQQRHARRRRSWTRSSRRRSSGCCSGFGLELLEEAAEPLQGREHDHAQHEGAV